MKNDAMEKKLRLEVLVAYPPTSKCRALVELMKTLVEEHPEKVRLDVYYAGETPSKVPTRGYQRDPDGKRRKIPSAYVNGKKVASQEVPALDEVRNVLLRELSKGSAAWE